MLRLARTCLPPSVHGNGKARWCSSSASLLLVHGQDRVKNTRYYGMSTAASQGGSHSYRNRSTSTTAAAVVSATNRVRNSKPNIAAQQAMMLCSTSMLAHRGRTADHHGRKSWKRHSSLFGSAGRRTDDAEESTAAAAVPAAAPSGTTEELARCEEEVLGALSGVCEPCSGKQVVQLGFVQDLLVNGEAWWREL